MGSPRNGRTTFTWSPPYTVWYNFVRIHKAHRLTPAMSAGLTDRLRSMEDTAALIDNAEVQKIAKQRAALLSEPVL